MRALVLQSPGRLELTDVPRPSPAHDQLLVRTEAALVCTSDINDVRRNPFGIRLPVVIGHEAAGTVEAVGRKVRGFSVGDRVATVADPGHGRADDCRPDGQVAFVFWLMNDTPVSFSETSHRRRASSSFFAAAVVPTFTGYPRIS